jgi:ribosomal protein S18 acetylase RimI-like enzyme
MEVVIQEASMIHVGKVIEVLVAAALWLKEEKGLYHWSRHISTWNEEFIINIINSPGNIMLVALYTNNVVGLVMVSSRAPDYHPQYSGKLPDTIRYISKLAVHPNRIGQGIGSLLLYNAELYILKLGCSTAALDWYKPAQLNSFYKDRGYKQICEDTQGIFAEKTLIGKGF